MNCKEKQRLTKWLALRLIPRFLIFIEAKHAVVGLTKLFNDSRASGCNGLTTSRYPDRDIQIRRGFEDGNLVFIHVYQNLNTGEAELVTMDVFKMDDQATLPITILEKEQVHL